MLSDEEKLTILRQCPELIGNSQLQLVNLITDLLHLWSYGVMISYRLIVLILNLVGYLAGIYQLLNTGLDNLSALGNLLDDIDVAGTPEELMLCKDQQLRLASFGRNYAARRAISHRTLAYLRCHNDALRLKKV